MRYDQLCYLRPIRFPARFLSLVLLLAPLTSNQFPSKGYKLYGLIYGTYPYTRDTLRVDKTMATNAPRTECNARDGT